MELSHILKNSHLVSIDTWADQGHEIMSPRRVATPEQIAAGRAVAVPAAAAAPSAVHALMHLAASTPAPPDAIMQHIKGGMNQSTRSRVGMFYASSQALHCNVSETHQAIADLPKKQQQKMGPQHWETMYAKLKSQCCSSRATMKLADDDRSVRYCSASLDSYRK